MKNALITIALAGLAMRPENVLAGGSMSMCETTKIYAEGSFISSSTACSGNCQWDGSSCSVSPTLAFNMMPTTEDFAAAISIGLTCSEQSPCTGDCETNSDGTCMGTKANYKSKLTDDAMAINLYLAGKCGATGESDCVAVSDCEWDATESECGPKNEVVIQALMDECNYVMNSDGTVSVTTSPASATTSIIAVLTSTVAAFLL